MKKARGIMRMEGRRISNKRYVVEKFSRAGANASVVTKLSWACKRRTGIRNDTAYCLLGILGISTDVRYGDHEAAFTRLLYGRNASRT